MHKNLKQIEKTRKIDFLIMSLHKLLYSRSTKFGALATHTHSAYLHSGRKRFLQYIFPGRSVTQTLYVAKLLASRSFILIFGVLLFSILVFLLSRQIKI